MILEILAWIGIIYLCGLLFHAIVFTYIVVFMLYFAGQEELSHVVEDMLWHALLWFIVTPMVLYSAAKYAFLSK